MHVAGLALLLGFLDLTARRPSRAEALFWLCLFLPFFAYLGYPALLALYGLLQPPPRMALPAERPRVSLIVAAYNEERHMQAKLQSLLDADYPHELCQIIIASDGSSDATVSLAQRFADEHPDHDIRVLDLPRGGKAEALNGAVSVADGDILVFSDADTLWEPDTLAQLVQPFADPASAPWPATWPFPRPAGPWPSATASTAPTSPGCAAWKAVPAAWPPPMADCRRCAANCSSPCRAM